MITHIQVYAPAGVELFSPGRNGTEALSRARLDLAPLTYECRWRRNAEDRVVVDRGYNIAAIARASLGSRAVQDVEEDGPDHQTLVLQPSAAARSALYRADLRIAARRTDAATEDPSAFVCGEMVRQTILIVPGANSAQKTPRPPTVKEIETICTYKRRPDGSLVGYQRTATFLVPDTLYTSQSSTAEQMAARLARTADGRQVAIDVRVYDVEYTPV